MNMGALDGERGIAVGDRLSPLLRRWVTLDSDHERLVFAFLITEPVYLFGVGVPW